MDSNDVINASELGDRVLHVLAPAKLTLEHLTIMGGSSPPGNYHVYPLVGEDGGAVYNEGELTLKDCVIAENSSGSGGIPMGNTGQDSAGAGGAIYSTGNLAMVNCLVVRNACGTGSGGGDGGGIYNKG
ncbi:MAG TPA: hypothetical protein VKA67_11490, partial [Verrucomicrobiae bacterium]|nr:hypothetical protein [Verrucomicrobiae bacterium]